MAKTINYLGREYETLQVEEYKITAIDKKNENFGVYGVLEIFINKGKADFNTMHLTDDIINLLAKEINKTGV